MTILPELCSALAEVGRLEAESEGMLALFGAGGRSATRNHMVGPRQRRRARLARKA